MSRVSEISRFAVVVAMANAAFSMTTVGATVPFVEDFSADAANWREATGTTPLDWIATGGPDGGTFASTTLNFVDLATNDTPVMFRGHSAYGSSGSAFVGDWVSSGVDEFSLYVRQDTGMSLNFFTRFASPGNFPGAAKVFVIPVPTDTWTEISTMLPDPSLVFEGPFTYTQVFGNVGNVQVGVSVPAALAGVDQDFTFGIDKISIVPEPATLALLLGGGLLVVRRRSPRKDNG